MSESASPVPPEDEPEAPAPVPLRHKAPGSSTRRDAPVVLERAIPDRDLKERR